MYGQPEYNQQGLVKCEICGEHFARVAAHVRQKHEMNAREYKIEFGFDVSKGLCSEDSAEKSREAVLNHPDLIERLVANGEQNRFKTEHEGRTVISEQTRTRLKARLKEDYMVKAMAESGRRLGLSGVGNKVRWSKKEQP